MLPRPVTRGRARAVGMLLNTSILLGLVPLTVVAQQRPLRTSDATILSPGTMRAEVGFDFLQDVSYPLSGLSGDQTSIGVLSVRMGVGRLVELQLEGAVQHFLEVKSRANGPVTPVVPGSGSTHDVGDFSLFTKVRIFSETSRRPALAFRFGFQMPNSNQVRGIGTNTSNLFAGLVVEKHIGKLDLFGNAGLGILQSPIANFTQNDVLTYGAAFLYPLSSRMTLAGEVAGHHSTRSITSRLIGTESRGQGRLGFQIFAGGFRWDVAGIAGLTNRDPRSGFTFGISKDIHLFDYPSK